MTKKYIPETFWDERIEVLGDLGDGYSNRDYQNYEDKIRMKKAFEILGDVSGLRILDVGCGTGRWSVQLAKRGAIVTGIDISKEMIKLAKERADKNQIHNITFMNKRIEDLNYLNYFNVAISVTVLQHITDEENLHTAVHHIVKASNGKLLIIESTTNDNGLLIRKLSKPIFKMGKIIINSKNRANDKVINDPIRNVEFMTLRTKEEWIKLFENEGVTFIKSKEVCFIGRYLFAFCASRFKNKTIKKVVENLSEFVDMNFTDWKLFNKHSNPTIFLFEK